LKLRRKTNTSHADPVIATPDAKSGCRCYAAREEEITSYFVLHLLLLLLLLLLDEDESMLGVFLLSKLKLIRHQLKIPLLLN
jgi:hypothetical protein